MEPLETDLPPVLIPALEKPKRKRIKPDGDPTSVSFKSASGDINFTAKSRKKKEPVLQDIDTQEPREVQPQQEGLYELMHEHLNTRSNRRTNAWQDFNIF